MYRGDDEHLVLYNAFPGWTGKALQLALIVVVGAVTTVVSVAVALLDWPSPLDHDPWETVGLIALVAGLFSVLGSLGWRLLISEARRRLDSPPPHM
jgi:hypothetical protein